MVMRLIDLFPVLMLKHVDSIDLNGWLLAMLMLRLLL